MMFIAFILAFGLATAQESGQCSDPAATTAFQAGFQAQKSLNTKRALQHYQACIKAEPGCVACLYEIGWTHWTRSEWDDVVATWEKVKSIEPSHGSAQTWLPQARNRRDGVQPQAGGDSVHIPIGTSAEGGGVRLRLVARFQNYNSAPQSPADHHDSSIFSPKSARFLSDGSKVYINSLEGFQTVVYDPKALERIGRIRHHFTAADAPLFQGENTVFGYKYNRASASGDPNRFQGKPVESALSHQDRYLWVPYYRRDFDQGATSPSAVSIVDTQTDQIVRVLPTGPIPKYVAISPNNQWAAIAHWGDNTLGVVDISSGDPSQFTYLKERLVVEQVLTQKGLAGSNRDSSCGFCLRGTVFTPDSKTLLVSRMGGGGLAAFDVETWAYLGTLTGEKPTPRHLVISPDGEWLFMSSNKSGYISKARLSEIVTALRSANGQKQPFENWESVYVGPGARTIEITADGSMLFTAVNNSAELVAIDPKTLTILTRVRTDGYAVGLDVAPDGRQVWVTSQGRKGAGGNSVCVFRVEKTSGKNTDTENED
jgi:DNA-binding beta-propeller fold protein YncE